MALITLAELKSVLGIGDIYADAIVQACADSAENIILSYLIFDDVAINAVSLTSNVARFYCYENTFVVGQALTVSKCGAPFDGSRTVTAVGTENLVTFLNWVSNKEGGGYEALAPIVFIMGLAKLIDLATGVNGQIIGTSNYWRFDFFTNLFYIVLSIPLNFYLISNYSLIGLAYSNLAALTLYNTCLLYTSDAADE